MNNVLILVVQVFVIARHICNNFVQRIEQLCRIWQGLNKENYVMTSIAIKSKLQHRPTLEIKLYPCLTIRTYECSKYNLFDYMNIFTLNLPLKYELSIC